jgi:hypothetical protein
MAWTKYRLIAPILGSLALLAGPVTSTAEAQERPAPAIEVAAGWIGFADDGIVSESAVGGAARWYLLPRVSVGPEILYINGDNHSHLTLTANVTFDLISTAQGRPRRMTPFVIAGGGLFRTRETLFNGNFTSNEGAFTAGGGVRALAGDRVTVGIDTRVGWELHVRVNGFVGVQLGR